MKRVKELDGLRAIAILLVMGCHYRGFLLLTGGLSSFGWVGVDIFFALSGYLITSILLGLRGKPQPYVTFYARRAVRIFPPYFLVTFCILFAGVVAHDSAVLTPLYLFKQFFFLQGASQQDPSFLAAWITHPLRRLTHLPALFLYAHNLPAASLNVNASLLVQSQTYWSLSSEEYFYLLWAPVVLCFPKKIVALIGAAVCFIEPLLRWSWGGEGSYFGVLFRFDALLYGAFLALLLDRWRQFGPPRYATRLLAGISLGSIAVLCVLLYSLHPIAGREIRDSPLFLVFGLPAISLACAGLIGLLILRAESRWWLARLLRTRPMQLIGTVSYTMYLVEILCALTAARLLGLFRLPSSNAMSLVEAILAVVLAVVIAKLSWSFFESPLLRWKDARFPASGAVREPALLDTGVEV